jgi:hypothetical protein
MCNVIKAADYIIFYSLRVRREETVDISFSSSRRNTRFVTFNSILFGKISLGYTYDGPEWDHLIGHL